jgi:hypothetical protein
MKRNQSFIGEKLKLLRIFIFCLSAFLSLHSCKHPGPSTPTTAAPFEGFDTVHKWIDWNILFSPNTTYDQRKKYLDSLRQAITTIVETWNATHGTSFPVLIDTVFCPCDSLLYNLNASLPISASGLVANPPPKPGNGTGGSGDTVNLNNSFVTDSVMGNTTKPDTTEVILKAAVIDSSKILAVMDTGLDSTLFKNQFAGLLWAASHQPYTLRNFLFFQNKLDYEYYKDDDKHKHGTAVTALALEALQRSRPIVRTLPKIMVLKVLDKTRHGSTFTVSCALSYAAQNKATLINASLGYYGELDTILRHYVRICNTLGQRSVPILAAAGNMPGAHDPTKLCKTPGSGNELTDQRQFFPACFSNQFSNLICVTGLQNKTTSCFYQNYSDSLVSVGVITNPKPKSTGLSFCCAFPVAFLQSGYEGSSFATPIVSGKMMGYIMQTPGNIWQNAVNAISTPSKKAAARSLLYK